MNISVDHIAFVLSKGCELHPHTRQLFFEQLELLKNKGVISLTPFTTLTLYHQKTLKRQQK